MPPRKSTTKQRTLAASLQEYGRGVAGGLMFSLPLLYTMEVWWTGIVAHPFRLITYVLATFVLLIGYNRYAGLRRDSSMAEVVIDSVEELGIGLLIAGLVLFLLGRVTAEMSAMEIAGVIVLEAMTVAIGVSIGTAQLGAGGKDDEGLGEGGTEKGISFGGQIVMGFCGAVLFAANVAPTEEIIIIAIEISWLRLMGLAILSLLVAFVILHFSDFKGADRFVRADHPTVILLGTSLTYSIALIASGLILWFFGRFDGVSLITALSQTIVLAVAATLGASAGRLLLQ
ncbi:MAG TPA: TIGR02587 family membrane protein [Pyrinomonadaceae bacterium]|nr:TIGR02587 family membrane protein [Pyrinomonadaceae bacterium]